MEMITELDGESLAQVFPRRLSFIPARKIHRSSNQRKWINSCDASNFGETADAVNLRNPPFT